MKYLKQLFLVGLFSLFLFVSSVDAHPGRTAADGCHYCRTNCDKWGVPWNTRHCHNSGFTLGTTTQSRFCKDNFWKSIALGEQKCDYGFLDFASGWGLVYLIGGFATFHIIRKVIKKNEKN